MLYGAHPHAIKFWSSVTCMKMFYLRIATISGSLLWVWNDSLHILYRFNNWRPPWVPIYNLIILWLVDGDLLCEQEMGDLQAMAIKRWSKVLQLQAVWHVPKKYLPIIMFDIHMRLCSYICENLDGEILANFCSVINFVKF